MRYEFLCHAISVMHHVSCTIYHPYNAMHYTLCTMCHLESFMHFVPCIKCHPKSVMYEMRYYLSVFNCNVLCACASSLGSQLFTPLYVQLIATQKYLNINDVFDSSPSKKCGLLSEYSYDYGVLRKRGKKCNKKYSLEGDAKVVTLIA